MIGTDFDTNVTDFLRQNHNFIDSANDYNSMALNIDISLNHQVTSALLSSNTRGQALVFQLRSYNLEFQLGCNPQIQPCKDEYNKDPVCLLLQTNIG